MNYISLVIPVITGLLGFLGAWLGARLALANFKKQKAFDKQLDWYERASLAIYSMAEAIQIADTFQSDKKSSAEDLAENWRAVQRAHLELDRMSHDATLYGSHVAKELLDKISKKVQKLSNETDGFTPVNIPASKRQEALIEIYQLSTFLEKSSPALLAEARKHLGIDE